MRQCRRIFGQGVPKGPRSDSLSRSSGRSRSALVRDRVPHRGTRPTSNGSRCRHGSQAATYCATSRATSFKSQRRAVASRSPSTKTGGGEWAVRGARPHAHVHDHCLRTRPIGARRLSRSSARVLQRPVRVRAAGGARRRADRGNARAAAARRCARTGAWQRRSHPARSTSAASGLPAADYDELLDHPVEIGDFESVEFEAGGVPHHFVVAGRFESDLERVARTRSRSARRRSSSSARPRRSIAIGCSASPSATATAGSSIARRRA